MPAVHDLTWPRGVERPSIHLLAGDALKPHSIRVRVHVHGWPRGDLEVEGTPIPGMPADGALATFAEGLTRHGLIAAHPSGGLTVALGEDSAAWREPEFLELLAVACRSLVVDSPDFTVGLLGYGAIGAEHARAVLETPGLQLSSVCDLNPDRAETARQAYPDLRIHGTPEALLDDPTVDVVVISTPPDSHASWARAALDRGKHVVVEKPMALTVDECDELLFEAKTVNRLLAVYQNRRFDADYRLVKHHVDKGSIGEVFHIETFIGGYSHPCNYWHSDARISGGALYDWGSHVVDQLLDLVEGEVEHVTAVNHKRVWHDVTNADFARMTMHFTGGREASFIYSDISAALKPRWYVVGTHGALTSEWREASIIARNAIGTLEEDVLAPADSPPRIRLHTPAGDVSSLANLPREAHPFHSDLSLHLRYGVEARVQGAQSRRVISMLQAAEESAALGGVAVKPS
jgi:scyllo-inositol 2-dehydrogenase (NADP+)